MGDGAPKLDLTQVVAIGFELIGTAVPTELRHSPALPNARGLVPAK